MIDIERRFHQELADAEFDSLTGEGALQVCIATVARLMHSEVASLYELTPSRQELTLIATVGLAHSGVGFARLTGGEGVTGYTAEIGRPYAVADVASDVHFKLIPGFDQSGHRSILAAPIFVEGVLIGALNVQTVNRHDYDDTEIQNLEALATLVGSLFGRWHNNADSARQLRGPRLLSLVDGMAAAALAPRELCRRLIDDLAVVLPRVECGVMLPDEPKWVGADLDTAADDVVTITLRGEHDECGVLAFRSDGSDPPPWDNPAAWQYVGSIAKQFGVALERALAVSARRVSSPDADVYDSLVAMVLADQGLDALVDEVTQRVGAPVTVLDSFGILLSSTLAKDVTPAAAPLQEFPVRAGAQPLGTLQAWGAGPATAATLEAAAQVIALELIKSRVSYEVEARLRGDLLELLLSDVDANPREVLPRASLSGLDLRRSYTPIMLAIEIDSVVGRNPIAMRSLVELAQRNLGGPPTAVIFQRENGVLALVDETSTIGGESIIAAAEQTRAELSRRSRGMRVGLGIGQPTVWPVAFRRCVHTATRAAEYAMRINATRGIRSDELGSYALLVALEPTVLAEYVQTHLGVLIEQDERSGGDMIATLEAYHLAGDQLKAAAEALFIHVNTMKYRIARIEALTNGALSSPVRRHDLYLALHGLRVIDPARKTLLADKRYRP